MAIAFEELEGSPKIRITDTTTKATRYFRVAWDDWPDFVELLLGRYQIVGCSFVFVPPLEFPGLPNVVVADVTVEPFDPENPEGSQVQTLLSGTNRYPAAGAKVTVVYETLLDLNGQARADLPPAPGGTFLTFRADLGSEQVALPGRLWKWDDGAAKKLPPDRNPQIMVPTATYRLTWHRVVFPPWDAIRSLRGAVNDAAFAGAPAGTLLFAGARVSRSFQFRGAGGFWRLEYSFQERALPISGGVGGWNYHFDESTAGWIKIKDSAGNPPYRAASFDGLFQLGGC